MGLFQSKEELSFVHDVQLIVDGIEDGFHQVMLDDHTTRPTRFEFCVKQGHTSWQGLCDLIHEKFKLSQKVPMYLKAWVVINEPCWSEERGDYYREDRRIINDATDAAVIASYIYNPDVDFYFHLTNRAQEGICINPIFNPTARYILPPDDYIFTKPVKSAFEQT